MRDEVLSAVITTSLNTGKVCQGMSQETPQAIIHTITKLFILVIFLAHLCIVNDTFRDNRGVRSDLLAVSHGIALESAHGCNT
jgi:hypothetical protein